jgi:hypothetical protein
MLLQNLKAIGEELSEICVLFCNYIYIFIYIDDYGVASKDNLVKNSFVKICKLSSAMFLYAELQTHPRFFCQ